VGRIFEKNFPCPINYTHWSLSQHLFEGDERTCATVRIGASIRSPAGQLACKPAVLLSCKQAYLLAGFHAFMQAELLTGLPASRPAGRMHILLASKKEAV
jgi:hypothetical protein